jgi:hypothetical protein
MLVHLICHTVCFEGCFGNQDFPSAQLVRSIQELPQPHVGGVGNRESLSVYSGSPNIPIKMLQKLHY